MSAFLPPEIAVEHEPGLVSYSFPARDLGNARWAGIFPMLFGLAFASFPVLGQLSNWKRIIGGHAEIFEIVFGLFAVPFVAAGLTVVGIGLFVMFGRSRLEWREGRLSTVEIAGPIRWRRRLSPKSGDIRKLLVSFGVESNGKLVTTGPLAKIGALVAEFEQGKPRMAVLGYPSDWLHAVARDLAAQIAISGKTAPQVELVSTNNTGFLTKQDTD